MICEAQWKSQRARGLVKLLALAPGHQLHRDQNHNSLWPDAGLSAAANSLHQTLFTARRILNPLAPGCLTLGEGFLNLSGGEGQVLSVDIDQFEAAADQARGSQVPQVYQSALALYSGELLPEDRYEEWAVHRRNATPPGLSEAVAQSGSLARNPPRLPRRDRNPFAPAGCRPKSRRSPHRADANVYLKRSPAAGTAPVPDPAAKCCRPSWMPNPARRPTNYTKLSSPGSSGWTAPVSLPIAAARHHNLPAQLTSFIGREQEIADVSQLVRAHRLVTLTGSGGTGRPAWRYVRGRTAGCVSRWHLPGGAGASRRPGAGTAGLRANPGADRTARRIGGDSPGSFLEKSTYC